MEYAMFIAVVAAALVAMNVYVKRAIQANLKQLETQMNAEAMR
jgi:Flp pilus assembly pilin Flp